jgi:hypothetical protein
MSRPWLDTVSGGISAALNARGAADGCGPLVWTLTDTGGLSGLVGAHVGPARAVERAAAWAALLGLDGPAERPLLGGTVEYSGVVDGMPVVVWAVVDRVGIFGITVAPSDADEAEAPDDAVLAEAEAQRARRTDDAQHDDAEASEDLVGRTDPDGGAA